MIIGSVFNCKWPAKVLQELFTPRFVPDPEFKPFDLGALRGGHTSDSSHSTNSPELPKTKGENPVFKREDAHNP
jgi:hypothetical protein